MGSPLSAGLAGSSHSRSASTSSTTGPPGARHPPSPIGIGFASAKPSPPSGFAPSSLNDTKRPGTSGSAGSGGSEDHRRVSIAGDGISIPQRKRYSSSFGHRYAPNTESPSGGAGNSSGSSTPITQQQEVPFQSGRERKTSLAASFLSTTTDDDDISVFVQDIDARKPLSGRHKEREDRDRRSESLTRTQGRELAAEPTIQQLRKQPLGRASSSLATVQGSSSRFSNTSSNTSTKTVLQRKDTDDADYPSTSTSPPALSLSPTKGPMLTNQADIDERLRRMNETFHRTLEAISDAGTNEAKRRERDRKREREKERDRQREKDREARQNSTDESGGEYTSRGGSSALTSPTATTTPVEYGPYDGYAGGLNRWTPYSLGMGLRRPELSTGSSSTSSGLLGRSEAAVSQGSEEVIGRMDLYEGPKSRAYHP